MKESRHTCGPKRISSLPFLAKYGSNYPSLELMRAIKNQKLIREKLERSNFSFPFDYISYENVVAQCLCTNTDLSNDKVRLLLSNRNTRLCSCPIELGSSSAKRSVFHRLLIISDPWERPKLTVALRYEKSRKISPPKLIVCDRQIWLVIKKMAPRRASKSATAAKKRGRICTDCSDSDSDSYDSDSSCSCSSCIESDYESRGRIKSKGKKYSRSSGKNKSKSTKKGKKSSGNGKSKKKKNSQRNSKSIWPPSRVCDDCELLKLYNIERVMLIDWIFGNRTN